MDPFHPDGGFAEGCGWEFALHEGMPTQLSPPFSYARSPCIDGSVPDT